ncbi:TonB-dependent receptor [Hyphomicrobium sp. D-2]|uniref:TonB-dependent receptor domain-containing protein n=1 Tax=Hyphomicrobium sp. D-2 TaxID=3041621 RepID=UPI002457D524|nr:TonB-dependent receptor [Hyphomicrobium sp. D-2]MDH4980660.1 TonB-dependent receptor [Hyphomicrobium sp. D-2]
MGLNYGQRNLSRTKVDTYTARYRYAPSDNRLLNVKANLWYADLEHTRDIGWTYVGRNHSMETTGADISNRSVITTAVGELTVDAGGEYRQEVAFATETNERWRESRGPNGVRNLASAYGKTTLEPTNWLELSAGARFDHYSAEGKRIAANHPDKEQERFSPNAGLIVKPFDGLQLYAQYTEGFRAPSLRELYWDFRTALLRVNPNIRGEVSKNTEFGANVLRDNVLMDGDKARFKASYFRNQYDDFILYALVPGGGVFSGPYEFTNIDRANYHGLELSGSYDAGVFFAEGAFTKYLKAEYCTGATGCRMPNFGEVISNVTPPTYVPPEWSGSVTAGVRLFDQSLTLGTRVIFSSTRIGTDWPTTRPGLIGFQNTWPDFVVFDLFGSYQLSEKTMLNFSVENATDQYYYGPLSTTAMPSPGRTARIGFTHTFGE